ncbi:MAG TPA: amino acid permease, partial [Clostridia bacterium]|nr:amino acid permease [Clostridia bacterium]
MKKENNSEISQSNKLGPIHIWALGVGVVLVGQFMGWNLGIMKGGSIGSLLACWIIGILYVCLIMVNTEMGTFIPEAGGQYAMAKYFMGPLAAFNIGLMLVFEYVMLEAADALVVGELLKSISPEIQVLPFILLSLLTLTYLNYKGSHGSMNVNIVLTGVAFATILILLASTKFYSPGESLIRLRENI